MTIDHLSAVDGTLVLALDSTYAIPPKGWFDGRAPLYKKRQYSGEHGWGSQVMDSRNHVPLPNPTGMGLSALLESGKDLEAKSSRWHVPPARSRVFSQNGGWGTRHSARVYLILEPFGNGKQDKMVTVKTIGAGVKEAELVDLPPLSVLHEILQAQLADGNDNQYTKDIAKGHKSLLSLTEDEVKFVQTRKEVRTKFNKYLNDVGKSPQSIPKHLIDLDRIVDWIVSHDKDGYERPDKEDSSDDDCDCSKKSKKEKDSVDVWDPKYVRKPVGPLTKLTSSKLGLKLPVKPLVQRRPTDATSGAKPESHRSQVPTEKPESLKTEISESPCDEDMVEHFNSEPPIVPKDEAENTEIIKLSMAAPERPPKTIPYQPHAIPRIPIVDPPLEMKSVDKRYPEGNVSILRRPPLSKNSPVLTVEGAVAFLHDMQLSREIE